MIELFVTCPFLHNDMLNLLTRDAFRIDEKILEAYCYRAGEIS